MWFLLWVMLALALAGPADHPMYTFVKWPAVSERVEKAALSQRDLGRSVPINMNPNLGINVTLVIFEKEGVTALSLGKVRTLLDMGVQVYSINFYYNEFTDKWQLCPRPFSSTGEPILIDANKSDWNCTNSVTVNDFILQFTSYCSETNTEYLLNQLEIAILLYNIPKHNTSYQMATDGWGNHSLSDLFAPLGLLLYTPEDMSNERELSDAYNQLLSFPTWENFILLQYKRVLVTVLGDQVSNTTSGYNVTDTDKQTLFFDTTAESEVFAPNLVLESTCKSINAGNMTTMFKKDAFYYITDYNKNAFAQEDVHTYLRCGFSPILSELPEVQNITDFTPYGFWLWDLPWEPLLQEDISNNSTSASKKCVALYPDGFRVDDCYNEYIYACQARRNALIWSVNRHSDKRSYFDGYKDDVCPDGYQFLVPRLPYDLHNLVLEIASQEIRYPVWVDFNAITVEDCFVTGGPYAQCPYKRMITNKELVKQIAPSFLVSAFLILLVALEKFVRINPIQTNRKAYWRKVVSKYNENHPYEGVPS